MARVHNPKFDVYERQWQAILEQRHKEIVDLLSNISLGNPTDIYKNIDKTYFNKPNESRVNTEEIAQEGYLAIITSFLDNIFDTDSVLAKSISLPNKVVDAGARTVETFSGYLKIIADSISSLRKDSLANIKKDGSLSFVIDTILSKIKDIENLHNKVDENSKIRRETYIESLKDIVKNIYVFKDSDTTKDSESSSYSKNKTVDNTKITDSSKITDSYKTINSSKITDSSSTWFNNDKTTDKYRDHKSFNLNEHVIKTLLDKAYTRRIEVVKATDSAHTSKIDESPSKIDKNLQRIVDKSLISINEQKLNNKKMEALTEAVTNESVTLISIYDILKSIKKDAFIKDYYERNSKSSNINEHSTTSDNSITDYVDNINDMFDNKSESRIKKRKKKTSKSKSVSNRSFSPSKRGVFNKLKSTAGTMLEKVPDIKGSSSSWLNPRVMKLGKIMTTGGIASLGAGYLINSELEKTEDTDSTKAKLLRIANSTIESAGNYSTVGAVAGAGIGALGAGVGALPGATIGGTTGAVFGAIKGLSSSVYDEFFTNKKSEKTSSITQTIPLEWYKQYILEKEQQSLSTMSESDKKALDRRAEYLKKIDNENMKIGRPSLLNKWIKTTNFSKTLSPELRLKIDGASDNTSVNNETSQSLDSSIINNSNRTRQSLDDSFVNNVKNFNGLKKSDATLSTNFYNEADISSNSSFVSPIVEDISSINNINKSSISHLDSAVGDSNLATNLYFNTKNVNSTASSQQSSKQSPIIINNTNNSSVTSRGSALRMSDLQVELLAYI